MNKIFYLLIAFTPSLCWGQIETFPYGEAPIADDSELTPKPEFRTTATILLPPKTTHQKAVTPQTLYKSGKVHQPEIAIAHQEAPIQQETNPNIQSNLFVSIKTCKDNTETHNNKCVQKKEEYQVWCQINKKDCQEAKLEISQRINRQGKWCSENQKTCQSLK